MTNLNYVLINTTGYAAGQYEMTLETTNTVPKLTVKAVLMVESVKTPVITALTQFQTTYEIDSKLQVIFNS